MFIFRLLWKYINLPPHDNLVLITYTLSEWDLHFPSPKVIKNSCSTQLSTKFELFIKLKYWQMKKFLALSLWYVLFNIYEQDKFRAQLGWA